MNIWSKLEVSGIFENAWAHSGMLRNPWRCLRTLRNTQECAGPHVEAFGAVRSTHLQFWLPQGNDQPSLGIAKTHLESFDRLWHAREYEGMHCCCACLRMSRFPVPCCTGFWWTLMSLMGSNLDGFLWIWSILGSKSVSKTFDSFFREFGMPWNLQKYCFTAVKHTFSQIPFTASGVTFRYYLGHFCVALEAPP